MIKKAFVLELITRFFLIAMLIILYLLNYYVLGNDLFSFPTILMVLALISIPIHNLFRLKQKIVLSSFYYIALILLSSYVISKSIAAIILWSNKIVVSSFFNGIDIILISIFFLLVDIASIFLKKEEIIGNKQKESLLISGISLASLIAFGLNYPKTSIFIEPTKMVIWAFSLLFSLFLLLNSHSIYNSSKLRLKIGILCLLSLYEQVFILVFLCIYLLIYADQFLLSE